MRKKRLFCSALSLSLALAMTTPVTYVSANGNVSLEDKLAIATNEDNRVSSIDGKLSDQAVDSAKDAKKVIENVSNLLGIQNTDNELRFFNQASSEFCESYDFRQYYKGLEVINSCVTVVVSKKTGEAQYLTSSFDSGISVDVNATFAKENAVKAVEDTYQVKASGNVSLVVYKTKDSFKLAWKIATDSRTTSEVFVDAHTGEIILAVTPNGDVRESYTVERNNFNISKSEEIFPVKDFTVDLMKDGDTYKLYDQERNIYLIGERNPHDVHCVYSGTDISRYYTHLSVLKNVEKAYDFYSSLNWKGPDGKNAPTYVSPCTRDGQVSLSNAYSITYDDGHAWLGFGIGDVPDDSAEQGNYGADIDIVTHEYTHSVSHDIVHWGYPDEPQYYYINYGEMLALGEAYGDIMGELNDDTREWQHGTDQYYANTNKNTSERKEKCNRDIVNPKFRYYTTHEEIDGGECHEISTIISHAAYEMYQSGLSVEEMKKIWFNSFFYLPHGTYEVSFMDCRKAVIKAAEEVFADLDTTSKAEKINKVKAGFNSVHLFDKDDRIGDINLDNVVDQQDMEAFRLYLVDQYTITDPEQIYNMDVNFDGVVDLKDYTTFRRKGDVNLDGFINEDDYKMLNDGILKSFNNEEQWIPYRKYRADMNGDGKVNVTDLLALREKLGPVE